MRRLGARHFPVLAFLAVLLRALPAAAGPEVDLGAGVTSASVTPSPRDASGFGTYRLGLGWSFRGHAISLGWRLDPYVVGSTGHGEPFVAWRSAPLGLGSGLGLVGLLSVRDATFGCAAFHCVLGELPASEWRRFPLISAGAGLTIPFEHLLVVPAVELGAAFPGIYNGSSTPQVVDVERVVTLAATLSFVLRRDPEPPVRVDGLSWVRAAGVWGGVGLTENVVRGPVLDGGVWVDVGLGAGSFAAGLRLDLVASTRTNGHFFGPAVEAFAAMELARGERRVVRGSVALGGLWTTACTSEECRAAINPLVSADVLTSGLDGGFTWGGRLVVETGDEVVAPGFVVGWSWR